MAVSEHVDTSARAEDALKIYRQLLRWIGNGAFVTLASLPLFLYLTLYVWPYLIFGSLIVIGVFGVGVDRCQRRWERAKFGPWLEATQLSTLPVLGPIYLGGFLGWVGINTVLTLSGHALSLPIWEIALFAVILVADLPLLPFLKRAQQRRRQNTQVRYIKGDRAEIIRAFRARLESRGFAFRYEDKGRALKPYIAPTFFLAGDSFVLLVLQAKPRKAYMMKRLGPEVPKQIAAEVDGVLAEALASVA